ncbi:class I SAM-dependent methyltransferase [Oceanomicrobium pacificus]|uniref:Methyltransferase domain-containing protein n=1 Tax=Oceanomicrobium pacificus TaxID=2692916 RepID=A0A6B0TWC9_9RHOB|nr:class I SAM-dependent methyltransferase [Oceanomicrobium pacificus]MXU65303.1 methyltransferase domain-containing protein [Oceanomicrobium pacificus]
MSDPALPAHPRLVRRYDRAADAWRRTVTRLGYARAYGQFVSAADRAGALAPGGAVADIGTGAGDFALAYAQQAARPGPLTLVDPSRPMLDQARATLSACALPVTCRQGALGDGWVGSAGFDTLLCAHVIEHLPDTGAALRHLRMLLHPGGTLLLVASKPHWCNALVWMRWQHRTLRPDDLVAELGAAGFSDVTVHPFASGPPSRTSMGYIARSA